MFFVVFFVFVFLFGCCFFCFVFGLSPSFFELSSSKAWYTDLVAAIFVVIMVLVSETTGTPRDDDDDDDNDDAAAADSRFLFRSFFVFRIVFLLFSIVESTPDFFH